jgi:DNA-binding response OmpR family regulator
MAQPMRSPSEHEIRLGSTDAVRPQRSVDTPVNHIRRRLHEAAPEWNSNHTHFGHGYRLEPERAERGHRRGRRI